MKDRKILVGILIILVFGFMMIGCDEPIDQELLPGVWYETPEDANGGGTPALKFDGGQLYIPDASGGWIPFCEYTFSQNSINIKPRGGSSQGAQGTAKIISLNEYELVFKEIPRDLRTIFKSPTYFKPGYSGSGQPDPGTTAPETPTLTVTASPGSGTYSTGPTVTLTSSSSGATIYYTTNGSAPTTSSTRYTDAITITADTVIKAIAVSGSVTSQETMAMYIIGSSGSSTSVTKSDDDNTAGTLRYVIAAASNNATITINNNLTINLKECLYIDKNITIQGQNTVITRTNASWTGGDNSLVWIKPGADVKFSGVQFKNGKDTSAKPNGLGGAIYNTGKLTVESCIFNNNQARRGGAIYTVTETGSATKASTTVKGCTFYYNYAGEVGGAIYETESLTLTGNVFYDNASTSSSVVYISSGKTVTNGGYNVVDINFGTGAAQSGWASGTGDTKIADPINTTTFAPTNSLTVSIPSSLAGFPDKDYNGAARSSGKPGAVDH